MECALASSMGLCIAGLSWLCQGRRGVGEGVGVWVSLEHEDAIHACVCMCMHVYACVCNLLTFLLLPYLFFNAVTIIRTRSREESGRLSR
jgi:hypothetical protein